MRHDGQLLSGEGQGLCRWSVVLFLVEEVFGGAFEEAMRWCGCAVMEAG